MSVIGNDSQKKSVNALKQKVKAGRWLSGNLTQIMVLLNGIILTVTTFIALNIFINQIVAAGVISATHEARDHFVDRLANLQKSLDTASSIVSFSGKAGSEEIVGNFKTMFPYDDYYDQIFWLEWREGGQYVAHSMLKGGSSDFNSNGDNGLQKLHQHVVQAFIESEKNSLLIGGGEYVQARKAGGEPMVLAERVSRSDGRTDIIYGLSAVDKIISPSFFDGRKNIQSIAMVTNDSGNTGLYRYVRPDVMKADYRPDESSVFRNNFFVKVADRSISLKVAVNLNERELFLKKMPLLMLAFGITLTLIGTLYVRNNQKQSLRLAHINMELAQKNIDLNNEVLKREKLNQALRKAEKENRAVIDAVSDIIFETSTDGQILFLNETWQKITGFSVERSLGRNMFDLLYMQDQAEQRSNFAQLVKGKKQAYRAFTRLRTADGNFRAVELAVSMIRQDENKELRVVGTITDVEERRRAERALSEAEKKYRAIVENAASGIYQVTPEGHYLSANPSMAKILGYDTAEEILRDIRNANADIYFNGRERERQLRDAGRNGTVNVECQIRKKDGSVIWVHENLRAVKDDDDQLLFFEGSIEDITQSKNTEIALRAAKVDSDLANRAKSEFLANMSHELRTPLNAIIGFSDIIRTQAFGEVGRSEYLDYARDINESGKRLLQVINEILDVSRIEAGERQLNEGVVDLNKLVQSALEMLAPKIEANRMNISNLIGKDTPNLIGENHAIKQMIINLLSNAVKFTPEGGRISIHANLDDYGQLQISITDTGIGLTDEEIEKALSPFGQVNTSLSKSESGTGLGLTLVQSLMSLHGGSFELFSQKGIGTTATLIFPPKRVSQASAKVSEEQRV